MLILVLLNFELRFDNNFLEIRENWGKVVFVLSSGCSIIPLANCTGTLCIIRDDEYTYVCIAHRWMKSGCPKKETKANHHIKKDVSLSLSLSLFSLLLLVRHSIFSFNSLLYRGTERNFRERCEPTRARVLSIVLASRRIFIGKKFTLLCSINSLATLLCPFASNWHV